MSHPPYSCPRCRCCFSWANLHLFSVTSFLVPPFRGTYLFQEPHLCASVSFVIRHCPASTEERNGWSLFLINLTLHVGRMAGYRTTLHVEDFVTPLSVSWVSTHGEAAGRIGQLIKAEHCNERAMVREATAMVMARKDNAENQLALTLLHVPQTEPEEAASWNLPVE